MFRNFDSIWRILFRSWETPVADLLEGDTILTLGYQSVVVGVVADPEPVDAVRFFNSEGSVSDTDADRP